MKSGITLTQSSSAFQQRVRNGQPVGGCVADGTGPTSGIGSIGSRRPGVAEKRARVYGCRARSVTRAAGSSSTIRPRYIVITRSLILRTVWMSCETKTRARSRRSFRSSQRLRSLGADRDVQRARRFVRHHQVRVEGQGARDGHPLALTAGQLAGQGVRQGTREAHQRHQLPHPVVPFPCRAAPVHVEGVPQDPAYGRAVQGRRRVLEDHARAGADGRPSLGGPHRPQVTVAEARGRRRPLDATSTFASVDFPHPDSPTTPTVSPGAMVRSAPVRAYTRSRVNRPPERALWTTWASRG